MNGKKKKPYTSRYAKFEGNSEYMDFDRYDELVEEGYKNLEIAKEFNVDEKFLKGMQKDMDKEY